MRHLGDRFADEDRHFTARGYTLFTSTTRYRYKNVEAFLGIENLTNVEWREAQFFFTSRLPGEPAGGTGFHRAAFSGARGWLDTGDKPDKPRYDRRLAAASILSR